MISLFAFLFGCLGVLSLLQGGQSEATGYGEGASYDRPSSGIPRYHDDEHLRQCRRRERGKSSTCRRVALASVTVVSAAAMAPGLGVFSFLP